MHAALTVLTTDEALAAADQLQKAYVATFSRPPHGETAEMAEAFAREQLPRHAARRGFRCVVARGAGAGGEPSILGFGYGYTSEPGQWWHDRVAAALDEATARRWLPGAFEYVVPAVEQLFPAMARSFAVMGLDLTERVGSDAQGL